MQSFSVNSHVFFSIKSRVFLLSLGFFIKSRVFLLSRVFFSIKSGVLSIKSRVFY